MVSETGNPSGGYWTRTKATAMKDITSVIEEINRLDEPSKRKLPLPDDELIEKYEKATGFIFPEDYKILLKNVSNAFVGYMSPLTLSNEMTTSYGDLLSTLNDARAIGLPNDWLPICEDNGDYYCLIPNGNVRFWSHDGLTDESWPNLATWAEEVWIQGH